SADLSKLDADDDNVYFSTPVGFMNYPFGWNMPLLTISGVLFAFLVFIGLGKRTLIPSEIAKGFLNLFGALAAVGILGFFGWKILLSAYPQYNDILQGFTYNGHSYILAFVFLALAVSFLFNFRRQVESLVISHWIAPLCVWLI